MYRSPTYQGAKANMDLLAGRSTLFLVLDPLVSSLSEAPPYGNRYCSGCAVKTRFKP